MLQCVSCWCWVKSLRSYGGPYVPVHALHLLIPSLTLNALVNPSGMWGFLVMYFLSFLNFVPFSYLQYTQISWTQNVSRFKGRRSGQESYLELQSLRSAVGGVFPTSLSQYWLFMYVWSGSLKKYLALYQSVSAPNCGFRRGTSWNCHNTSSRLTPSRDGAFYCLFSCVLVSDVSWEDSLYLLMAKGSFYLSVHLSKLLFNLS